LSTEESKEMRTPDGTEVSLSCPPSLVDVADPTKLAEALRNFDIRTPEPPEGLIPPGALFPPGSLGTVLPPDPNTGQPVGSCSPKPNESVGEPFSGFFASQSQLEQMGRLCGCSFDGFEGYDIRIDMYEATPGAKEAYRREARTIYPQLDPLSIDEAIGEERTLRRSPDEYDRYILLFRRRNVIARLELSYYRESSPDGKGPREPVLEYAAQLDRNIEAAAGKQP